MRNIFGATIIVSMLVGGLAGLFIIRHPGFLALVLLAIIAGHFVTPLPKDTEN